MARAFGSPVEELIAPLAVEGVIDLSDQPRLVSDLDELLHESEFEAVLDSLLGKSEEISTFGFDASWGPAHSMVATSFMSFQWEGSYWMYTYGDADLRQPFVADYLHPVGDDEAHRKALLDLVHSYAGAGLVNHPDPQIRAEARREMCVHGKPWQELPYETWRGWADSAHQAIAEHGEAIAQRLGVALSDVAEAIEHLHDPEGTSPGRHQHAVRAELWWSINEGWTD